MSDLDFYAHVATRRDVFGTGAGSTPGAWDTALGTDCLDDPGDGVLRRDYGLLEVLFSDAGDTGGTGGTDGSMTCFGIMVQVHRLVHGPCTPPLLVSRYGTFAPRVRFEDLRSAVLALGHAVEPDDLSGDIHRYRVPESGTRIHVIADPDPYGDGDHDTGDPDIHQAGDVWSLDVSPFRRGR